MTGNSLSPFFFPGDYVMIWTLSSLIKKLSPGDDVVFEHDQYGLLIKRILHNYPVDSYIEVEGINPKSLTSREIGRIPYENIMGKVILSIRQKR